MHVRQMILTQVTSTIYHQVTPNSCERLSIISWPRGNFLGLSCHMRRNYSHLINYLAMTWKSIPFRRPFSRITTTHSHGKENQITGIFATRSFSDIVPLIVYSLYESCRRSARPSSRQRIIVMSYHFRPGTFPSQHSTEETWCRTTNSQETL